MMRYLIYAKGGYYKNGEKQTNFSIDDVNDCFVYIMDRIYGTYCYKLGGKGKVKYDYSRMNLASFIHTWTRGWCNQIRKKAYRRYLRGFHKSIYLDDILENCKIPDNFIYDVDSNNTEYNIHASSLNEIGIEYYKNIEIKEDENFKLFYFFVNGQLSLEKYSKIL